MGKFHLKLFGGFWLGDPKGETIDIASRKGRGLIALLATSDNGERSRIWLQKHLWARGSSQDSLRKELSNLRASFSSCNLNPLPKDIPRDVIRLNLSCFEIDVLNKPNERKGEFLEGLEFPHEHQFEQWRQKQRAYYSSLNSQNKYGLGKDISISPKIITSTQDSRFCIGISSVVCDPKIKIKQMRKTHFDDILDRIAKLLLSTGGIDLVDNRIGQPVANMVRPISNNISQASLILKATEISEKLILTTHLVLNENNKVICANRAEFDPDQYSRLFDDNQCFSEYIAETADEILFVLSRKGGSSWDDCNVLRLVYEAVESMFDLTYNGLDKARANLDSTAEFCQEGVIYAWRAFLTTQLVDDPRITDFQSIREEAKYFAEKAVEMDRYNALVHSLLTHVYAFTLKDVDTARELMKKAKSLSSDHVMTHDADALLNLYLNDLKSSRQSALRAVSLGRFLPFRYLFMTSLCMIEGLAGNYDFSISAGEKSLQLQPANPDRPYPPTIRYLSQSYARIGRHDKACKLINQLKSADKNNFTLELTDNPRSVPTLDISKYLKIGNTLLT